MRTRPTAARDITRQLAKTGRKRVGMVAAALDRDSGADRLAGFKEALGDTFDPDLVVEIPLYEYTAGLRATQELLERAPDVDGIFAASDAVAAGVLTALRRSGRTVPDDVGVVGFDDSSWAERCFPPLSTVHQPAAGVGERAAQLAGQDVPRDGVLLDSPIVWRDSA